MIGLNNSEQLLKIFSSFVFRALLIIYAIILLNVQQTLYEWYVYVAIIIVYLIFYIILLRKKKHFLRSLNDYIFIFFILFDKDILEVYNIFLLLFPLINAPNHSSAKRRPVVLFLLTTTIFSIIFVMENGLKDTIFIYWIGFLFLILISYIEFLRRNRLGKLFKIFENIDKISTEKIHSLQLQKVYEKVIEGINAISSHQNNVEMIICFTESKKKGLQVRSTSQFILKYDLQDLEKNMQEKKSGISTRIILDDKEYQNIFYIKVKKYIFIIVYRDKTHQSSISNLIMTNEIIKPILEKIAKILDFESALNSRKIENLKKLNADLHNVNEVMKSIHFLKNKFTSLKTYFKLLEKSETVSTDKQEALSELIEETKTRAIISLEAIESKTLRVLDKTNSPFASYTMKKIKYKHIYMLVKLIWLENFYDKDVKVFCTPDDMENYCHNLNRDLLEFLFTDLIENIRKYSSGEQEITFSYDNYAKIVLKNKIHSASKRKTDLKELIVNFNKADRLEINRRSSYGLVHIMELSEMLKIDCELSFENGNYFSTILTFKGCKNENIDI